jgi:hypothetical protein
LRKGKANNKGKRERVWFKNKGKVCGEVVAWDI